MGIFITTALGGAVADIISKWFVFSYLAEFGRITIIPGFITIVLSINEGVVFGLFPGRNIIFIIFSSLAIVIIMGIYLLSGRRILATNLGLGLILAGAAGNLWDRIWFGYVRDFIDFHIGDKYHWPTFNIADSLICIGIFILAIASFASFKTPGKGEI